MTDKTLAWYEDEMTVNDGSSNNDSSERDRFENKTYHLCQNRKKPSDLLSVT